MLDLFFVELQPKILTFHVCAIQCVLSFCEEAPVRQDFPFSLQHLLCSLQRAPFDGVQMQIPPVRITVQQILLES